MEPLLWRAIQAAPKGLPKDMVAACDARKVRRNRAGSASRIDRVGSGTREPQHDITHAAGRLDIASNVAYQHVANACVNHQSRVARHKEVILQHHAASIFARQNQ
jgi:hypothetical protein